MILAGAAAIAVSVAAPARADVKVLKIDKSGKASVSTGRAGDGAGGGGGPLFSNDPSDPVNKFEDGELVVTNAPGDFASIAAGMGCQVLETVRLGGLGMTVLRVAVPRGTTVPAARQELGARFPGAVIDANHEFESQAREVMHARGAMGWANAPANCGRDIRLGQIDTGVDVRHAALRGQQVTFRSFHRKDRRPAQMVHGTAIVGMLVERSKWGGLMPGTELKAASMFETKPDGSKMGSAIGLLKSLSWLAGEKVHAINLSIAGTDNKTLRLAFDKAHQIGLVLVAAAGNWGRADRPAFPAAYDHVMAVTAVTSRKLIYSHANQGRYIDFAAPGVQIYAAVPGGARLMTGTSFATPYVTALLAERVAGGAKRSIGTLRGDLRRNVEDLGRSGKDTVFGYGLVKLKPACG